MRAYHKVLADISDKLCSGNVFQQTMDIFKTTEDPSEKFKIIDDLEQSGYFRKPPISPNKTKNNEESTKYRTQGNEFYVQKTNAGLLLALEFYNKSICYAENDSEELGLAFANRSAVYVDLRLYDDCLTNIQLAKQSAPKRVMDKLNNREKLCLDERKRLKETSPVFNNPELSFPAHAQVPFIANCLQLQQNAEHGQHVITVTDLKPGDVVAVEKAFCSSLHQKFKYKRCENCLKENNYNLIPCQRCVSVMFCSDECRDEAYERFHRIECSIIEHKSDFFCKESVNIFRTLICSITNFKSVDELITFIEQAKNQDATVFNCNYKEKSHKSYAPIHFLPKIEDADADFGRYILVSLISQALVEQTELKEKFASEDAVAVLREFILHHIERAPYNPYYAMYFNGLFDKYAEGSYPFLNLIRHSCVPNLIITSVDDTLVYTVFQPIKAREPLTHNQYYE